MKDTDPIETLLRADRYLDDDGFTARVVARLPRRRNLTRMRAAVLLAAALLAGALVLLGSGGEALQVVLGPFRGDWHAAPTSVLAWLVLATMIVWGCTTAASE